MNNRDMDMLFEFDSVLKEKTKSNTFNLYELLDILPNVVKIEIIKVEFDKIYSKEISFRKFSFDAVKNAIASVNSDAEYILCREIANYKGNIIVLIGLINKCKLTEEDMLDIYRWAKKRRKELGLSDNLFNIYPEFIKKENLYDNINEEINKQKIL